MFDEPHYYKSSDEKPRCEHHAGGDNWYSDVCVCFMNDGTFELLRYMIDDNDSSNDMWCIGDEIKSSVVAWMEV